MTILRLYQGFRMSQAIAHSGVVYLAGQIGSPEKPVCEQTREVLAKIEDLLAREGSGRIASCTRRSGLPTWRAFKQ